MARTADERKRANAASSRESRKRKNEELDDLKGQVSAYKRRLWDAEQTNVALVRVLRASLNDQGTSTPSSAVAAALAVLNAPMFTAPMSTFPEPAVQVASVMPMSVTDKGTNEMKFRGPVYPQPSKQDSTAQPAFSSVSLAPAAVVLSSAASPDLGTYNLSTYNLSTATKPELMPTKNHPQQYVQHPNDVMHPPVETATSGASAPSLQDGTSSDCAPKTQSVPLSKPIALRPTAAQPAVRTPGLSTPQLSALEDSIHLDLFDMDAEATLTNLLADPRLPSVGVSLAMVYGDSANKPQYHHIPLPTTRPQREDSDHPQQRFTSSVYKV